jgi:hypothetical protein
VGERVESGWISLTGLSWKGEFSDDMRKSVSVPASRPMAPWIRAASDNLTMAMAILYGLEKLNNDQECCLPGEFSCSLHSLSS